MLGAAFAGGGGSYGGGGDSRGGGGSYGGGGSSSYGTLAYITDIYILYNRTCDFAIARAFEKRGTCKGLPMLLPQQRAIAMPKNLLGYT